MASVELSVVPARRDDLADAVQVWRAANVARGRAPSAGRIARVEEKLAAADAVVLVVRAADEVVAMALAEPWRIEGGTGAVVAGRGHVSMVFVRPDRWGEGVGTALLAGLHREVADRRGWTRTSLWTRESNDRAQRLYLRSGYHPTGRRAELASADHIAELERP